MAVTTGPSFATEAGTLGVQVRDAPLLPPVTHPED